MIVEYILCWLVIFQYLLPIRLGKESRIIGLQNSKIGDHQSKEEKLQSEKTCSEFFKEILSRKNEQKIVMLMKYSTKLASNIRSDILQMNDTETMLENYGIVTRNFRYMP